MSGGQEDTESALDTLRDAITTRLRDHTHPDGCVDRLVDAVIESRDLEMVVLSADIRLSTLLMKESVDVHHFAEVLSGFMDGCQRIVFESGGYFDKFTGDGFLAYWIPDSLNFMSPDAPTGPSEDPWLDYLTSQLLSAPAQEEPDDELLYSRRYREEADDYEQAVLEALSTALGAAARLLTAFHGTTLPAFRMQSKNLTSGVGLSIGIDFGDVQLMPVARQFTIIGSPVVGAVRMVSSAGPWETLVNVYPGELLNRFPDAVDHEIEVEAMIRQTKEYDNQEVYRVSFPRLPVPTP